MTDPWRTLSDAGIPSDCPICGNDEWHGFGALENLMVALPALTEHGEYVKGPGTTGAVNACVVGCTRCGFLRLHAAALVDSLASEQG